MTRWLALTVTLCLSASVAGAEPIRDITLMNADGSVIVTDFRASGVGGAYYDVNQDTAFIFTLHANPMIQIDNTIFFGVLGAETRARLIAYDPASAYPGVPPAPEPAAALLVAAGAVSLALLRRRERR